MAGRVGKAPPDECANLVANILLKKVAAYRAFNASYPGFGGRLSLVDVLRNLSNHRQGGAGRGRGRKGGVLVESCNAYIFDCGAVSVS